MILGVLFIMVSFVVWVLVFLVVYVLDCWLFGLCIFDEFWNLFKFLVVIGMIFMVLEE